MLFFLVLRGLLDDRTRVMNDDEPNVNLGLGAVGATTLGVSIYSLLYYKLPLWLLVLIVVWLGLATFTIITLRNKFRRSAERLSRDLASTSGYIIIEMPDSKKRMFHDFLLGFEEYAELRGYAITVSLDSSLPNKLAFKLTLTADPSVSTQQVREDLQVYIDKVQNGDVSGLPQVVPAGQHRLLALAMANRINFLQNSLNVQNALIGEYRELLKQVSSERFKVMPTQHLIIQAGSQSSATTLEVLNSPQAAIGTGNEVMENKLGQRAYIAESLNERRTQIDAVKEFIDLLHKTRLEVSAQRPSKPDTLESADMCLRKVAVELEVAKPDPQRIQRWLETAKFTLKTFGLTKEVADAAKVVWEMFRLTVPF